MSLVNIASKGNGSVLSNIEDKNIQPNAVDLNIDRIFQMSGTFTLSELEKFHRHKKEISADEQGWYKLTPGSYEILFTQNVIMSNDTAGYVITRSTLNRNGVFITSGLYDSGYGKDLDGGAPMAACLHVNGGNFLIQRGSRVGQFVLWDAEALFDYDGSYGKGGEDDSHLAR